MSPTTRRPSRAPLYVTVAFFAIAVTLVLVALRGTPAPAVAIERAGTTSSPRDVAIIMRDYLFEPEPLDLVRGETVRFTVFNAGLEPHEFVLGDRAAQAAWASAAAAAVPPAPFATPAPASAPVGIDASRVLVGSGQQATVEAVVPASGELSVMCHLPGHVEQGMVGAVRFVVPGDVAEPSISPSR